MAGRIWCDSYTSDGMCSVEVDRFDHGIGIEMVRLSVHLDLGLRIARHVSDTNGVLDKPLVDGFGRMCHEYAALEIRLRKHVGQGSSMVDVKTSRMSAYWTVRRPRKESGRGAQGGRYIGGNQGGAHHRSRAERKQIIFHS